MRMCVLSLASPLEGNDKLGEGLVLARVSLLPRSAWSGVSSLRLQFTVWPVGIRPTEQSMFSGLEEKVRMAVYWMAMEANARSTMDFQEHSMVATPMCQDATAQPAGQGDKRHLGSRVSPDI